MSRIENQVCERIGPRGLARVLEDLLDQPRLVRLANACGLEYPGMRTRSQKRERIVRDLVERSRSDSAARKAIYRVLRKATASQNREWLGLSPAQRAARLEDDAYLEADGNLGRLLFLLALPETRKETDEPDRESALGQLLQRLDAPRKSPAKASPTSRESVRLRKQINELKKKVQHLEAQLLKIRDAEKSVRRELTQKKGELAETRMLVERLRNELESANKEVLRRARDGRSHRTEGEAALGGLAKELRRLSTDQRKLGQRIEQLADHESPRSRAAADPELLRTLSEAVSTLNRELGSLRKEQRKELRALSKQIAELREGSLAERPTTGSTARRPSRRPRARAGEERVGVFIDVQNVYYAARKLKGKLDFAALLDVAVGARRRIQAVAYVVESKEIDQTGFIALLRQLAIEVRRKTVQVRSDGSMKGDWDIEMALDVLDAAPALDIVVLVSGDGDFTSLVQRVKLLGPRVEVIAFPRNAAKSLLEVADRFVPLGRKFMIPANGPASRKKGTNARARVEDPPAEEGATAAAS